MRTLYTLFYAVGLLAFTPRVAWHAIIGGRYQVGLGQRLGRVPEALRQIEPGAIWIHAVSVGEVHAARGLIPHLRRLLPGRPVVLSTTTPTGQSIAHIAGTDATFYTPLDLPFCISPYLRTLRPAALLLVETELWPNLLNACRQHGIPVALVNGRLSERSYRRYRRLGRLAARLVRKLDLVCSRSRVEATRFRLLGVPSDRLYWTGNLKADAAALTPSRTEMEALRDDLNLTADRPVLVAGCTMPGEEEQVLHAFTALRAKHPEAQLLLAPRHPERFDLAEQLVRKAGLSCTRRSIGHHGTSDVLLLDTIGELRAVYGLGTVSFVGGSLVSTGGHNVLEPAVHGQPIVFGPSMENFAALAKLLLEAGGARRVIDADDLADVWQQLLKDPAAAQTLGERARAVALRDASTGFRTAELVRTRLRLV